MNYIATFWLKSGISIFAKVEIDSTATKQEAENGLATVENFIATGIKDKYSGTVNVGNTYVSIQEIAAYTISLVAE